MCGKAEENVNHVLSKCCKLVQKEYKRRNDWIGMEIHCEICRKYGIKVKEKWNKHKAEVVMENDKCKENGTLQWKRIIKYMGQDLIKWVCVRFLC